MAEHITEATNSRNIKDKEGAEASKDTLETQTVGNSTKSLQLLEACKQLNP